MLNIVGGVSHIHTNGSRPRDRKTCASLASRIGSSLGLLLRFWVLGALLTGCLRPEAPAKQPALVEYWPTAGWRTSAPEAQGMDGEKLAQMLAEVQRRRLDLHSLLVIRNGHIVNATYFGSYRQDTQHELYSCTKSFYCSGCSHLLSAIVQQHTGMNVRDYAQKNLLGPLGISSFNWERDAQGIPIGGWGLQLTPRDMAKFGYLYLHDGI